MGIKEIDEALDPYHGKGIEYAGLHEIRSQTTLSFAAAAGFALALGNHMERSRFQRVATFQTLEVAQSSEAGKPDQTQCILNNPCRCHCSDRVDSRPVLPD